MLTHLYHTQEPELMGFHFQHGRKCHAILTGTGRTFCGLDTSQPAAGTEDCWDMISCLRCITSKEGRNAQLEVSLKGVWDDGP